MTEKKHRSPSRKNAPRGREISRRDFLGLSGRTLIVAGGAVSLGGGGIWYVLDNLSKIGEVDEKLAEYKSKEQQLEPVIAKFERGSQRFSELVLSKLDNINLSPAERNSLSIPFELARINRENPDRNIYTLKRKDFEARRSLAASTTYIANPNYFFFDFNPTGTASVASFGPLTKSLHMSAAYDPENLLDNLVVYHELVHVAQDNEDRQELPREKYLAFFEDAEKRRKLKAIGLYEATAYFEEIYLLNLLTGGQFKEDVLNKAVNLSKYRRLLRSRPEQDRILEMLGQLAYQFYNSRSSLTGIDTKVVGFINNNYRQQFGAEMYDRTPSGFVLSR